MVTVIRNNLPLSENRKIPDTMAKAANAAKANRECIIPGQHKGPVVEGHTVQRALMKSRGFCNESGEVMSFKGGKMKPFERPQTPSRIHCNHALTEYFSCEKHDGIFQQIELPNEPDFRNERHLNLFAYKAILGELKKEENLLRGYEAVTGLDEAYDYMMEGTKNNLTGKIEAKEIIERQIGLRFAVPDGKRICHRVAYIPSDKPMVAASAWCGGAKFVVEYSKQSIWQAAMWGCTVYPRQDDHVIVYHYLNKDRHLVLPELEFLREKNSRKLQRAVSADLLDLNEAVVISQPGWEELSGRQRKAITKCYHSGLGQQAPLVPAKVQLPKPFKEWSDRRKNLVNLFTREPK